MRVRVRVRGEGEVGVKMRREWGYHGARHLRQKVRVGVVRVRVAVREGVRTRLRWG